MGPFKVLFPAFVLLLLSGCRSGKADKEPSISQEKTLNDIKGNFSISGAYALYPLIEKMADDFMQIHPDVRIEVSATGSGQGITELLTKKHQLAMISRPLTDEEINDGIWVIPVAKDGVAPIINQNNPYFSKILDQGISPSEFIQLFISGKQMTWGDILGDNIKDKVVVYTRADESGAADVWAEFLYKKATDLQGIGVTGDEEMIKSIQANPLAIGFCNFSYAFEPATGERKKDIQIVPADLDFDNKIDRKEMPFANLQEAHRSLWLGFYPEDLCRELTIGSLGKPADHAVIEFLYYVLSEGQKTIKEKGFCELNNVYIKYSRDNLE